MTHIGRSERVTQNRVIALFRDELHDRYLDEDKKTKQEDKGSELERGFLR